MGDNSERLGVSCDSAYCFDCVYMYMPTMPESCFKQETYLPQLESRLYPCTHASLYLCTLAPLYPCTVVPLYTCTRVPPFVLSHSWPLEPVYTCTTLVPLYHWILRHCAIVYFTLAQLYPCTILPMHPGTLVHLELGILGRLAPCAHRRLYLCTVVR